MGYITEGMNIHGILVGEDNFRVQIEKVIIPNAPLPIPINKEMYLVGHVVGSFVTWPQPLVLWTVINNHENMLLRKEKRLVSEVHNQKHHGPNHKSMS